MTNPIIVAMSNFSSSRGSNVFLSKPRASALDIFGRLGTAEPFKLFDLPQAKSPIFNLFYDDQEVSGGGTYSVHIPDQALVEMGVTPGSTGKRVRQTFQPLQYQAGRSVELFMTCLSEDNEVGVIKEWGAFNDRNGVFFRQTHERMSVVVRSSTSGIPQDLEIPMEQWSVQPMDYRQFQSGTFDSTVEIPQRPSTQIRQDLRLDINKVQLWYIRYGWHGASSVTFGVVVGSVETDLHTEDFGNSKDTVEWSVPSVPLRWSIESTGSNVAIDKLKSGCVSASSLGGSATSGTPRALYNNQPVFINGNTNKAIFSVRMKPGFEGSTLAVARLRMSCTTRTDAVWGLALNAQTGGQDLNDTETWLDLGPTSSIQVAYGVASKDITFDAEKVLDVGWLGGGDEQSNVMPVTNSRFLGHAIDGTPDHYTLFVQRVQNSGTDRFFGGMEVRELI